MDRAYINANYRSFNLQSQRANKNLYKEYIFHQSTPFLLISNLLVNVSFHPSPFPKFAWVEWQALSLEKKSLGFGFEICGLSHPYSLKWSWSVEEEDWRIWGDTGCWRKIYSFRKDWIFLGVYNMRDIFHQGGPPSTKGGGGMAESASKPHQPKGVRL